MGVADYGAHALKAMEGWRCRGADTCTLAVGSGTGACALTPTLPRGLRWGSFCSHRLSCLCSFPLLLLVSPIFSLPVFFSRIVFLCHRLRLCDAFSGAAAAAAGRGSPPPPGAGVRGVVGGYGFVALCSAITMLTSKGRQGAEGYTVPSPRPPGRAFAIPLERNGWSGGWGPGGGAWCIFDFSARGRSVACAK